MGDFFYQETPANTVRVDMSESYKYIPVVICAYTERWQKRPESIQIVKSWEEEFTKIKFSDFSGKVCSLWCDTCSFWEKRVSRCPLKSMSAG